MINKRTYCKLYTPEKSNEISLRNRIIFSHLAYIDNLKLSGSIRKISTYTSLHSTTVKKALNELTELKLVLNNKGKWKAIEPPEGIFRQVRNAEKWQDRLAYMPLYLPNRDARFEVNGKKKRLSVNHCAVYSLLLSLSKNSDRVKGFNVPSRLQGILKLTKKTVLSALADLESLDLVYKKQYGIFVTKIDELTEKQLFYFKQNKDGKYDEVEAEKEYQEWLNEKKTKTQINTAKLEVKSVPETNSNVTVPSEKAPPGPKVKEAPSNLEAAKPVSIQNDEYDFNFFRKQAEKYLLSKEVIERAIEISNWNCQRGRLRDGFALVAVLDSKYKQNEENIKSGKISRGASNLGKYFLHEIEKDYESEKAKEKRFNEEMAKTEKSNAIEIRNKSDEFKSKLLKMHFANETIALEDLLQRVKFSDNFSKNNIRFDSFLGYLSDFIEKYQIDSHLPTQKMINEKIRLRNNFLAEVFYVFDKHYKKDIKADEIELKQVINDYCQKLNLPEFNWKFWGKCYQNPPENDVKKIIEPNSEQILEKVLED